MLAASALLETWATAHNHVIHSQDSHTQHQLRLARIFSVLVVGLLLPMSGTIILLTGETILMLRLFFRRDEGAYVLSSPCTSTCWRSGFRVAASKWGLTASMIAFVWTLQDRIAEIGAAGSVVLWLLLNVPARNRS